MYIYAPTQRVEACFDGAGMWDLENSRFAGAPDWDAIGRALEKLKVRTSVCVCVCVCACVGKCV